MQGDIDDLAWNKLIAWLQSKGMKTGPEHLLVCSKWVPGAGRALFVTKAVPSNTPLFTVPKSAHMNIETLAPFYGPIGTELTATQLISAHLFLHRAGHHNTNSDFGPYISILPTEFDVHPLSWMIVPQKYPSSWSFLLSLMPPAARSALNAVAERFWGDWKAVLKFLGDYATITSSVRQTQFAFCPFVPEHHVETYLWAWLNVNTRCVYHHIDTSTSEANNLTLCPLLDLANHTSSTVFMPPINPIPTFFSPSSRVLEEGDEVFLRYGPHSNVTLFTEYGFVEERTENGGQADVQDILETLFEHTGDARGEWMKSMLTSTNYWGDWKLYDTPTPAHPSYRLLPALRLMKLPVIIGSATYDALTPELEMWEKTLTGETDIVSPENERQVWAQLLDICEVVSRRAEEGIVRLQHWHESQAGKLLEWQEYAVYAVKTLWLEEQSVAQAVMQNIRNGEAAY